MWTAAGGTFFMRVSNADFRLRRFVISRKTPGERPRGPSNQIIDSTVWLSSFLFWTLPFCFYIFYPDRHISGARRWSLSPPCLFQGLTTCIHLPSRLPPFYPLLVRFERHPH